MNPNLTTVGSTILVHPLTEISQIEAGNNYTEVSSTAPFKFRIAGSLLDDDNTFFGIYGTVFSGPAIFQGLICSAMLRISPRQDWTELTSAHANFKIGFTPVRKNERYENHIALDFFYHPDGTSVVGFPVYIAFAKISVIS